jgi:type II secretion system protein N
MAYGSFGVISLLFSLYLTFPVDALGQRVENEIRRATKGSLNVSLNNFSFYRFSGIQAEDVQVTLAKQGGKAISLKLEALKARINLLPLFLLQKSLSAYIYIGGGELSAEVDLAGNDLDVSLSSENVALEKIPFIEEYAGMPITGKLSGQLNMEWRQNITKSKGHVELELSKLALGAGSFSGFTIPALTMGNVSADVKIEKGKFKLNSFKQAGGDLSARLHFSSDLRPSFMASSLDACAEFKLDKGLLDKNPNIKTALQLAEVQLKKDKDDYLHAAFRGTMSRPRLRRQALCSDSSKSQKKK